MLSKHEISQWQSFVNAVDTLYSDKHPQHTRKTKIIQFLMLMRSSQSTRDLKLDSESGLDELIPLYTSLNLNITTLNQEDVGHLFELVTQHYESYELGEHFTPPALVELLTLNLCNKAFIAKKKTTLSVYDPTAGTGGLIFGFNTYAKLPVSLYGQEYNSDSHMLGQAEMLRHNANPDHFIAGNTLVNDGYIGHTFDIMIANPPYGVSWATDKPIIEKDSRFTDIGLPRTDDGIFLFIELLLSKMKPASEGGSRVGIILSETPLFSGTRNSGEQKIRQYLFDNDLIESLVRLPSHLFVNTDIVSYMWTLTNIKEDKYKGQILLVDGNAIYEKNTTVKRGPKDQKRLTQTDITEIMQAILDNTTLEHNDTLLSMPLSVESIKDSQISFDHYFRNPELPQPTEQLLSEIDTLITKLKATSNAK
jgi:type I restriction enzyme M protein